MAVRHHPVLVASMPAENCSILRRVVVTSSLCFAGITSVLAPLSVGLPVSVIYFSCIGRDLQPEHTPVCSALLALSLAPAAIAADSVIRASQSLSNASEAGFAASGFVDVRVHSIDGA